MSNSKISKDTNDMGSFIGKLKREDNNLQKLYKILKITYIVLLIIYIPIFYFEIEKGGLVPILKVVFIVSGFSIFLFCMAYAQKKMKKISYAEPTLMLLKKTEKRYRIFHPIDLASIPAFLFLAVGLGLNEKIFLTIKQFFNSDLNWRVYLVEAWQFLFSGEHWYKMFAKTVNEFPMIIVFMATGLFIYILVILLVLGYILWILKYKPIRDNALELIKEIEN
ncbi:hypothetical protein [Labilibaculum manganireducens]|uniref:Uncharacterized protein n=1 Tax=Labilibaculum manganireducens TaxID=1940525 RepID=A0A2N3IGQ8_9BACT|nr:hypothetical protein [Labilibaculum manganireducens]PKQ69496.1 hypothetical protein BZG01_00780 [Labilibaculum manganireducens]